MRLGVVPFLDPHGGGTYQHSLSVLAALAELKERGLGDDLVLFVRDRRNPVVGRMRRAGWRIEPVRQHQEVVSALRRFAARGCLWRIARIARSAAPVQLDPDRPVHRPRHRRRLQRLGIDLMLYPTVDPLSFEAQVPYVMTVHDLQFRLQPEFPECAAVQSEWEYLFRNAIRSATMLTADSEVGREDILNLYGTYGVTADRIRVLPYLPASYMQREVPPHDLERVRNAYRLPARYLFYPAQFWPHKNHARIVQALEQIRSERRMVIPLVMCGSHSGELRERTFAAMMDLARSLGVERQLLYLGFVPDGDMAALYAGGEALLMPTLFGPTNIPVPEAWSLGCPVVTSDIRGIREQCGDAALLVDPRSVEAIASAVAKLWSDPALRTTLVDKGRRRLALYGPAEFRDRLADILEEAKRRLTPIRPEG